MHYVIFSYIFVAKCNYMKQKLIQVQFPIYRKLVDDLNRIKQLVFIPDEFKVTVTDFHYLGNNTPAQQSILHYVFKSKNPRNDFRSPLILCDGCIEITAEDYETLKKSNEKLLN